jgi:hypothetical protein
MTDYLRPKGGSPKKSGRQEMENGIFRNPPQYTALGGFTSEAKFTDPSGMRKRVGRPSLEKGGPSAQRGKPI